MKLTVTCHCLLMKLTFSSHKRVKLILFQSPIFHIDTHGDELQTLRLNEK